jgi:hypothetical protein
MVGIIQNINLGGPQDFPLNYESVSDDFNATFDAAAARANAGILLAAENAYKQLASALSFENGDSIAAEDYTSAGGANSTVNIGSSTANFNVNQYELDTILGTPVVSNWMTSIGSNIDSTRLYGNKITMTADRWITTAKRWADTTGGFCYIKDSTGTTIYTSTLSGSDFPFPNIKLNNGEDYYIVVGTTGVSTNHRWSNTVTGVHDGFTLGGAYYFDNEAVTTPTSLGTSDPYNLDDITMVDSLPFYTSGEVVCDANTLAIDAETNDFALYSPGEIPTGTSVSFDLFVSGSLEFDISAKETSCSGIAFNGTDLYIGGTQSDAVHGYDTDGNYNGVSFSTIGQDALNYGLTWDGTHFWMCGANNDFIYKYTDTGTYTGTSFSTIGEMSAPKSVYSDGTNIWVLGYGVVYLYDMLGVYSGTSYDLTANTTFATTGLVFDGTNWWVSDELNNKVYKFDSNFVYEIVISGPINLPVNSTTKKTEVIPKGALTNTTNIAIKQKFTTTDTAVTPTGKGWSLVKL